MVTFLLIVLAVLVAAGIVATVAMAFNGCLVSKVWVCFSMGTALEFLADLAGEILNGLKG